MIELEQILLLILMSWQLISITDIDLDRLVIKHPQHIGNDDKGKPKYTSEIWYKPEQGKPFKPVFKTPRLKIKYSCKQFKSGYGYCISSYNSDIDDEIGEFFTFVRKLDRKLNHIYRQTCKIWKYSPSGTAKYFSSIKKAASKQTYNNSSDNGYMQLKVITNNNKGQSPEPLTKINDSSSGDKLEPESIRYGFYSDQIIGMSYLYYNSEGIRPVWYAHQAVVSESVNVFLEYCLLNDVGSYEAPLPPPPPPSYSNYRPPPPPMNSSNSNSNSYSYRSTSKPKTKPSAASLLSSIQPGDLLSAIGKLKATKIRIEEIDEDNDSKGNLGISSKMLQERKRKIDIAKQRQLVIDSADMVN